MQLARVMPPEYMIYEHSDMPNVLIPMLEWSNVRSDAKNLYVQFIAIRWGREYYTPRTSLRDLLIKGFNHHIDGKVEWRMTALQFCPVIDVDIFKIDGDNPVLMDIYTKGLANQRTIVQFVFQYLLDCIKQYIDLNEIKYFIDWGSSKGIHLWFTPIVPGYILIEDELLCGVDVGEKIARLIQERGLWKASCMSPMTIDFLDAICKRLSVDSVVRYLGSSIDPYLLTLIRQYKDDYVFGTYADFLTRRMGHGVSCKDGQDSFDENEVLNVMYGFLYPKIDSGATGPLRTISLPYEVSSKGYFRHHFMTPEDVMSQEDFNIDERNVAYVKAEKFIAQLGK